MTKLLEQMQALKEQGDKFYIVGLKLEKQPFQAKQYFLQAAQQYNKVVESLTETELSISEVNLTEIQAHCTRKLAHCYSYFEDKDVEIQEQVHNAVLLYVALNNHELAVASYTFYLCFLSQKKQYEALEAALSEPYIQDYKNEGKFQLFEASLLRIKGNIGETVKALYEYSSGQRVTKTTPSSDIAEGVAHWVKTAINS